MEELGVNLKSLGQKSLRRDSLTGIYSEGGDWEIRASVGGVSWA